MRLGELLHAHASLDQPLRGRLHLPGVVEHGAHAVAPAKVKDRVLDVVLEVDRVAWARGEDAVIEKRTFLIARSHVVAVMAVESRFTLASTARNTPRSASATTGRPVQHASHQAISTKFSSVEVK